MLIQNLALVAERNLDGEELGQVRDLINGGRTEEARDWILDAMEERLVGGSTTSVEAMDCYNLLDLPLEIACKFPQVRASA